MDKNLQNVLPEDIWSLQMQKLRVTHYQLGSIKLKSLINHLLFKINSAINHNQIYKYLTKLYNSLIQTPCPVLNVKSFRFWIREDLSYLNLQMCRDPTAKSSSTLTDCRYREWQEVQVAMTRS